MYTNDELMPIQDFQQYIASDGTRYPYNFPKSSIPELKKVTETPMPTDNNLIITGFIIDSTLTLVWQTKIKTDNQKNMEAQANIPDLATQLATILITKGTILQSDLKANTIDNINAKLGSLGIAKILK